MLFLQLIQLKFILQMDHSLTSKLVYPMAGVRAKSIVTVVPPKLISPLILVSPSEKAIIRPIHFYYG
jgi:hypothetical protein